VAHTEALASTATIVGIAPALGPATRPTSVTVTQRGYSSRLAAEDPDTDTPIPLVRVLELASEEAQADRLSRPSLPSMPIIALESKGKPAPRGQVRFDDYAIASFLAKGGSGVLYKAKRRDDPNGPRYALKVLQEHLCADPATVAAFEREAQLMGALEHKNLVGLHGFGSENGEPFLLMEYVEGVSLAEILHHPVPIPLDVGLIIVRDALVVLDYVHNVRLPAAPTGLLHCDVSPHNLLVGKDGQTRLIDFGTSRAPGSPVVDAQVRCKPRYSSPELMAGEAVGPTSDVFAVGAVLFEMLSRQPAFSSDPRRRKRESFVPNPSLLNRRAPTRFDALCQRALAPAAADRFQSAREMLEAIDQAVASSQIELRKERVAGWVYRLLRSRSGDVEFDLSELEDLLKPQQPRLGDTVGLDELRERRGAASALVPESTRSSATHGARTRIVTTVLIVLAVLGSGLVLWKQIDSSKTLLQHVLEPSTP
jgi:serine/threonine protein kinase